MPSTAVIPVPNDLLWPLLQISFALFSLLAIWTSSGFLPFAPLMSLSRHLLLLFKLFFPFNSVFYQESKELTNLFKTEGPTPSWLLEDLQFITARFKQCCFLFSYSFQLFKPSQSSKLHSLHNAGYFHNGEKFLQSYCQCCHLT